MDDNWNIFDEKTKNEIKNLKEKENENYEW